MQFVPTVPTPRTYLQYQHHGDTIPAICNLGPYLWQLCLISSAFRFLINSRAFIVTIHNPEMKFFFFSLIVTALARQFYWQLYNITISIIPTIYAILCQCSTQCQPHLLLCYVYVHLCTTLLLLVTLILSHCHHNTTFIL